MRYAPYSSPHLPPGMSRDRFGAQAPLHGNRVSSRKMGHFASLLCPIGSLGDPVGGPSKKTRFLLIFFFRFFSSFSPTFHTPKNNILDHCPPICTFIQYIYGGKPTKGGIFYFLCAGNPGAAGGECCSHGCSAYPGIFLITRNEPRCLGAAWESTVPTIATPGNFLMPRNEPGRPGEAGEEDSHDRYTWGPTRSS